jgi:hypothetical protein
MNHSDNDFNLFHFITRIRRNHALEHATIHVLSAQNPKSIIVGRSDHHGFFLYTDLPKSTIEEASQLALARLRAGEHRLAIHPNCGTNLLTAGALSGLAAFLTIQGSDDKKPQDKLNRLLLAIMSAIASLVIAQPIGLRVQQYLTTKAEPGPLEVVSVNKVRSVKGNLYRVLTRQ